MIKLIENDLSKYTLDTREDFNGLPMKGIATGSTAQLMEVGANGEKGNLIIYYFTKRFDNNKNEIEGIWGII